MCGEVGVGKYALLEKLASVEDATELGQGRYLELPALPLSTGDRGGRGTRGQGPAIEPGREWCERSGGRAALVGNGSLEENLAAFFWRSQWRETETSHARIGCLVHSDIFPKPKAASFAMLVQRSRATSVSEPAHEEQRICLMLRIDRYAGSRSGQVVST